ncbi:hypothetical protein Aperf_G00000003261 [Anoplocephala perfoliata]
MTTARHITDLPEMVLISICQLIEVPEDLIAFCEALNLWYIVQKNELIYNTVVEYLNRKLTWIDAELRHFICTDGANVTLNNSFQALEHYRSCEKHFSRQRFLPASDTLSSRMTCLMLGFIDESANDKESTYNAFKSALFGARLGAHASRLTQNTCTRKLYIRRSTSRTEFHFECKPISLGAAGADDDLHDDHERGCHILGTEESQVRQSDNIFVFIENEMEQGAWTELSQALLHIGRVLSPQQTLVIVVEKHDGILNLLITHQCLSKLGVFLSALGSIDWRIYCLDMGNPTLQTMRAIICWAGLDVFRKRFLHARADHTLY